VLGWATEWVTTRGIRAWGSSDASTTTLSAKYGEGERSDSGPLKHFFAPKAGDDVNVSLASFTAVFSLGIALAALFVSIFG
jgi:hypothetical protein